MNQRYRANAITEFLSKYLLPWFTLVVNFLLVVFTIILVARDFSVSIESGVRGLAAATIPLVVVALTQKYSKSTTTDVEYRHHWFMRLTLSPLFGILISAAWGFVLMEIVYRFGIGNDEAGNKLPLAELVLSSTFVSLNNYAGTKQTRAEAYYSGVVLGFLVYLFVKGLPFSI